MLASRAGLSPANSQRTAGASAATSAPAIPAPVNERRDIAVGSDPVFFLHRNLCFVSFRFV
ncbi:hypothetical protein LINPERPRIM_LOCUS15654 [Linum perenne]